MGGFWRKPCRETVAFLRWALLANYVPVQARTDPIYSEFSIHVWRAWARGAFHDCPCIILVRASLNIPGVFPTFPSMTQLTDIAKMRVAGRLAADTLDYITPFVVPGVTTEHLDKLCHEFILSKGGIPTSLGYRGFPKSICTSPNHVVCHGIPSDKVLYEGDIVNLDVAVTVDDHIGDTSRTFAVGEVGVKAKRLMKATYDAMMEGIAVVAPGLQTNVIGATIQSFIENHYPEYSIVKEYAGHGVNTTYHDWPTIPHYEADYKGATMIPGMTFTVEPMINVGKPETKILQDGWTVVTKDRSLSAQYEHTVLVTETGYEILTSSHLPV